MQRRSVLIATSATAIGVAGCLDGTDNGAEDGNGDDGTSVGNGDPKSAVQAFFDALGDGDAETANSYIHPESELEELTPDDAAGTEAVFGTDVEIVAIELEDEDDDEAIVAVTIEDLDTGGEETETFSLRRDDGDWKLWDVATDDENGTEQPRAAVEVDIDDRAETVTVIVVANDNAEYVVVDGDVDPEAVADESEGPDDEIRLEAVGESIDLTPDAGLRAKSGQIEAIAVRNDTRTVVMADEYDFS